MSMFGLLLSIRANEYMPIITIDEVIKEFLPNDEDLVKSIARNLENTAFTKRDLAEGIMEGVTDSDFQISALMLFSKLSTIAQDLNSLTFLTKFNSVTNAVGPTIADTFILRDRYENEEIVKKVLDIAMGLEGMPRQASTHACRNCYNKRTSRYLCATL